MGKLMYFTVDKNGIVHFQLKEFTTPVEAKELAREIQDALQLGLDEAKAQIQNHYIYFGTN